MSSAQALMGVGMPAEVAKRAGFEVVDVTTTTATQGTGGGLLVGSGNKLARATITSASDSVTLPAAAAPGDEVIVSNLTANAGVVFPHSGGNINGNTTDSGTATLAAQGAAGSNWRFVKINATRWAGWSGADQT
jgi:hypothetical protein